MAGSTMAPEYAVGAAASCHIAAAEIQRQLARLRRHVLDLEADRPGLPKARFRALVAGYDIYARMLDDALHDIAEGLRDDKGLRDDTRDGRPIESTE